MVCLGNICRSPLAEGILKSKIDPKRIFVDSAGTGHWHIGDQPDLRSIEVAKKHNVDITNQRGRLFTQEDFLEFDHIFVMDNSNKENVFRLCQEQNNKNKVRLILDELYPGENVDVPDPYYGGDQGFESVYQMLDQACDLIAKRL